MTGWKRYREKAKGFRWKEESLILGLLLAFGFFINRQIQLKGLFMDDLYLWSCYGEQSFAQYVFPIGGTRFRFVFYLISYLFLAFIGPHVEWIVPINIILNVLVAYTICRFSRRLCKSGIISLLCGLAYLLSRMSYYQIGQMYGLMETFALWAAVGILYFLYSYLNDGRERALWGANILYFGICFIHERYLVLLPLLLLSILLRGEKRVSPWLLTAVNFVLIMGIRLLTIGTLSPAGTAGTDVADTFHIGQAIRFAFSQVAYVFGINAGPDHLSGLSFQNSPGAIRLLVVAADLILLLFVAVFLVSLVRSGKGARGKAFQNIALFMGFLILCIGSSSVTIRVEMRWVYVSFAGALLFLSYMAGFAGETGRKGLLAGLMGAYALLLLPSELFYRSQFENLYLWPNQLRYNSLAEETFGTYGEEIFGKTIYILDDTYEISDFTARTFFKVFDRERKAEGLQVEFADSIRDFGLVTEDMLVLAEDPAHNRFTDVTAFVRDQKLHVVNGYYSDGWMDQKASLRLMAGESGVIRFEGYYPDLPAGGETVKVTMTDDSGKAAGTEVAFDSQSVKFELKTAPYQTVNLEFEANFYTASATEQRGTEKMAFLLNIFTENDISLN